MMLGLFSKFIGLEVGITDLVIILSVRILNLSYVQKSFTDLQNNVITHRLMQNKKIIKQLSNKYTAIPLLTKNIYFLKISIIISTHIPR